jgi:thiamine biosynthesis lipoprotein
MEVFNDTFFAMGTRCDVVLPTIKPHLGEQVFQHIKKEVTLLENQLSRFIPQSPVSELNKTKKNHWYSVDEKFWEILTICYDFYQISNGAFDVTAAPLISLWKNNNHPSEEEISKALEKSGFDKIEFDLENQSIRFLADEMEFDFGAIGKGIALDALKTMLRNQGVKNAIVSFGKSSVLALGKHPQGDYWPLGIHNQLVPDEYVHVFQVKDNTITTAGTMRKSDDGRIVNRQQIVSPATGQLINTNSTVSVLSDSAVMGEFISTTWLILPENDKILLSEKLKNIEILEVSYLEDKDVKTKLTILNE